MIDRPRATGTFLPRSQHGRLVALTIQLDNTNNIPTTSIRGIAVDDGRCKIVVHSISRELTFLEEQIFVNLF